MLKIYYENKEYSIQIEYCFEILGNCIGQEVSFVNDINDLKKYESNCLNIVYSGNYDVEYGINGIIIREGNLFSDVFYLKKESIVENTFCYIDDVPVLFGNKKLNSYSKFEWGIECYADIVQSIFYLVTSYEEYVLKDAIYFDEHSRFKVLEKYIYKQSLMYRPLVNEYASKLYEWAEFCGILLKVEKKRETTVHLTHDLDHPFAQGILTHILQKMKVVKPKLNLGCEIIREDEMKRNIVSSWYIMHQGENAFDGKYECYNPLVKSFAFKEQARGCELGYHYSYEASEKDELALKEAENIRETFKLTYLCGRNHFLRYKAGVSENVYSQLNIFYDTTQGCAYHEGFYRGVCIPYQLFDLVKSEKLKTWEIPLIVMDGTLRDKKYRGLTPEEAYSCIEELLYIVDKYKGVFSILWHNTSVCGRYWRKWYNKVYLKFLNKITEEKYAVLMGGKIINLYKNQKLDCNEVGNEE